MNHSKKIATKIFIISNIRISNINFYIHKDDILVFINLAVNFDLFENYKNEKHLICRFSNMDVNYKNFTKYEIIDESYDIWIENYKIPDNWNLEQEKKWQCPTTGFLIYKKYKNKYPNYDINLVNFNINDNSTFHWIGHNWNYEYEYYKQNNVHIIIT
jgi:hypothetical protein